MLESRQHFAAVTVTQFDLGVTGAGIKGIALGADGNFWFTEPGTGLSPGRIGRLTPAGVATQFPLPTPTNRPQFIAAGSDGNMWFTESPGSSIGRITPDGTVTEFPIPTANAQPQHIIAASDGNLWFTEYSTTPSPGKSKISRLTTDGVFTEFSTLFAPPPPDNPAGLVDRGDGTIWYVANGSSRVGFQGVTSGVAGETSIPTANSGPFDIANGSDGTLYYTESATDKIGRIDNLFTAQSEISLTSGTEPEQIISGPDGNLYFTENGRGAIGRLNPNTFSVTAEYKFANTVNGNPVDLIVGPDKNIWFTEPGRDELGRLNLYADPENFTALVAPHPTVGQPISGNVATFTSTLVDSLASDFVANIDWGDGTLPTVGTIQKGAGGKFFVAGAHTYADATPSGTPDVVTVTLSRPNGDYPQTATADANVDGTNGPAPVPASFSIGNVSQNEGNSGTSSFAFTVTRNGDLTGSSSVTYATADGSATTLDNDYQAASNTLAFGPGEFSKTVTVLVNGDTKFETDETFLVNLSSPVGATIAVSQATGTIKNDDASPPPPPPPTPAALSINSVSTTEGNSGLKNLVFTVTRSGDSTGAATVKYTTAGGTASSGSNDYIGTSGSLSFAAGELTKTITVQIKGDTTVEADETFKVVLSNAVGAALSNTTGTGTIKNDDAAPVKPKISIGGYSHAEMNSGLTAFTFKVTLDKPSNTAVSVKYATSDGTAKANDDYNSASGTVTFAAGQTVATITIYVKGGTTKENDETFFVNLSSATNATISVGKATGLIKNDD